VNQQLIPLIIAATQAKTAIVDRVIQTLWSGYGEIVRFRLQPSPLTTVVVKWVAPPNQQNHPRGWNTDLSHQRKLQSYQVEMAWYQRWAPQCDTQCRVPHCYLAQQIDDNCLIVLEDLDAAGYPLRKTQLEKPELLLCLQWLANFHGRFLGQAAEDLWPTGTYWHLATRPDEWAAMEESELKRAAQAIDNRLSSCRYQTLVHGDAKIANFCFSEQSEKVAAVDFQYVGTGCGMKDVAYFLGSCLDDQQCQNWEQELLDHYFHFLREAVVRHHSEVDIAELEKEWRNLFAFAWTDFYRFLMGWMPDHWKINHYTRKLCRQVLSQIELN
jgi:Ecdysteroid kinase-like family